MTKKTQPKTVAEFTVPLNRLKKSPKNVPLLLRRTQPVDHTILG